MNEELLNADLDTLTEDTARKIIWTLQPGAYTADPIRIKLRSKRATI